MNNSWYCCHLDMPDQFELCRIQQRKATDPKTGLCVYEYFVITYYDGNEEKNIYTDTKGYSIKYVDGNNNTMLIVDSDGYGEGSNYKKIDLTNNSVNNADFSVKRYIRTIEYK